MSFEFVLKEITLNIFLILERNLLPYSFSITDMFTLNKKRYPYTHDRPVLQVKFTNFTYADGVFHPDCLKEKYWEFIKLDLLDFIKGIDK